MTITLRLSQSSDIHALSLAVYRALLAQRCVDLASESAVLVSQARDAAEYLGAVLSLSDELEVVWEAA